MSKQTYYQRNREKMRAHNKVYAAVGGKAAHQAKRIEEWAMGMYLLLNRWKSFLGIANV